MDPSLHCNILKCRKLLNEKAVVTTCSHIFCVSCANEKFSSTQLCPACETSLTENDDVVLIFLDPTNDYKTSVLSGLSPTLILEICSRAMSFWTYQVHQESSYQAALLKNANERNAALSKQLENVLREANTELEFQQQKVTQLDRELELERRKGRDLADTVKERDKEYQKLKNQFDGIKRKALLAPGTLANSANSNNTFQNDGIEMIENPLGPRVRGVGLNAGGGMTMNNVANGMAANHVQRTPLRAGAGGHFVGVQSQWQQQQQQQQQPQHMPTQNRRPAGGGHVNAFELPGRRNSRGSGGGASDGDEIEEIPGGMPIGYNNNHAPARGMMPGGPAQFNQQRTRVPPANPTMRRGPTVIAPPSARRSSGGFRPAAFVNH